MTNKNTIKLYRYMTNDAAIQTLENHQLRISEVGLVNDPFEFAISPTLKEEFIKNGIGDCLNRDFGFLSFSEKDKDNKMWGDYAECHCGVCFEFEFEKSESQPTTHPIMFESYRGRNKVQNKGTTTLVKVNYEKKLYTSEEKNRQNSLHIFTDICSRKGLDWASEKEWRLIIQLNQFCRENDGRKYLSLDNFKLCFTNIILGCKNPYKESDWNQLYSQSMNTTIKSKSLKMKEGLYELEYI